MIKSVGENTFVQVVNGQEIEHSYSNMVIENGTIKLPIYNNQLEVLILNNQDDKHSLLVTKIFAKVASLQ